MKSATVELLEKSVTAARQRQRPSERNLRIADEVRVGGRTQVEVAAEFGISQRRVSQICQQVDRWFASPGWLRGEPCGKEQGRTEDELARRQLAEIYRRAMRAYARSERALVTRKSGERKEGEHWSETSEREQRLDTGSLRVALRAIEQQARLAHRPVPMYGNDEQGQVQYMRWAIAFLGSLRDEAERSGSVQRGSVDSRTMVEEMLRTLLGGEAPAGSETRAEPAASEAAEDEEVVTAGPYIRAAQLETRPHVGPLSVGEGDGGATNGRGYANYPSAVAATSSSTEACGLEGAAGEEDAALAAAASAIAEASCGDGTASAAENSGGENSADRRADQREAGSETRAEPTEPTLARRRQEARARVEYYYGMGISDERLAEELKFLDRWERGRHTMQEQSRDLREALAEYRRLMGRGAGRAGPVASSRRSGHWLGLGGSVTRAGGSG